MKKCLLSVVAALFLAIPAFSVEWGGIVNEEIKISLNDFSTIPLEQSNSAFIWLKVPFNSDGNWNFNGEVLYKYTLSADDVKNISSLGFTNFVDVDLLKISGLIQAGEGSINLNSGRFFVSDLSGCVFLQNSDGFQFKYSLPAFGLKIYAGYTGLLNANNVTMLDSTGEIYSSESTSVYKLSSKYIPAILTVEIPALFENQSLGFEGSAFINLDDVSSGLNSSYYGTVNLKGPMFGSVYYSVVSTFGSQNFKNVSNFSAVNLNAFIGENFVITAGAKYASGKQACFSAFRTITSGTAYNSMTAPQYSGLIIGNAGFIYSKNDLFVSSTVAAVMGLPETTFTFNGVEGDVSFAYNIFSDLQVGADVTAYYGVSESSESKYVATIKAAISF